MTETKPRISSIPIHPILVAIYPVLVLYYINIQEMEPAAILQALVTVLVITALVAAFYWMIFRSWARASLLTSFTMLLALTYGHVYNLVAGLNIAGFLIGRHRNIVFLWLLLYVAGMYLLVRIRASGGLTKTLNLISISITAIILIEIGVSLSWSNSTSSQLSGLTSSPLPLSDPKIERDVYYILIDAYSREDLLRDRFGIDSSELMSKLQEMGFYIPGCAQSNYDTTYSSLASSLNMDYVDALGIPLESADPDTYKPYIHDSLVRRSFEKLGYKTITFKSLHPAIDITDSTYYFDYFKNTSALDQSGSVNFQYLFLNTTIMRPVLAYLDSSNQTLPLSAFWSKWIPAGGSINSREYKQYQQNVFALETLADIPHLPGKKFVYAHLFVTHQPFVFYPDGRFHPALIQDDNAYRDQVLFANQRIPEVIASILAQSNPKPIIIVQSDHSFVRGSDRVKILNAYYLPDSKNQGLYDSITPVNTFRLIFNTYFGGNYEMLPDVSRYVYSKVGKKKEIHEALPSCVK